MISTQSLILRLFLGEDAVDVFEYWEEPTANCFACMKLNSPEEAQAAVKKGGEGTDTLKSQLFKRIHKTRN